MEWKLLTTVFATVFLAELGDKTQLATFLYAADAANPKLTVFVGAAAALVAPSALGVFAGGFVSQHVSPRALSWVAGLWAAGTLTWAGADGTTMAPDVATLAGTYEGRTDRAAPAATLRSLTLSTRSRRTSTTFSRRVWTR